MKYITTKVLSLRVVTMLKKMVDLLWYKTVQEQLDKIRYLLYIHLNTTGRRIWINDIEFADYNGDGIAKGFLANAGVDLTGFDQEVLRQVEHEVNLVKKQKKVSKVMREFKKGKLKSWQK